MRRLQANERQWKSIKSRLAKARKKTGRPKAEGDVDCLENDMGRHTAATECSFLFACKDLVREDAKWGLFQTADSAGRPLQLDFWAGAERYAGSHAADIDFLRQQDTDEAAQADLSLQTFLASELRRYSSAVQARGAENVLVWEPLIDLSHAGISEMRINWVLEELYARLPADAAVFPLENCIRTDTGFSIPEEAYDRVVKLWDRQRLRRENKLPEDFHVEASLRGNRLSGRLQINMAQKEYFVAYRLLRNNERVDTKYDNQQIEWELSESGIYRIEAHLNVGGQRAYTSSYPVEYFTQQDQAAYQTYLRGSSPAEPGLGRGIPPLRKRPAPFSDFLVVSCRNDDADILSRISSALPRDRGFRRVRLPAVGAYRTTVITDGDAFLGTGFTAVLSGVIEMNGRFINGDQCIPAEARAEDFHDSIGMYAAVVATTDSVAVVRDYFQCAHLFYYQSGGQMLISNCYHLLLTALSSVGAGKLDLPKAMAMLTIPGTMLLSANFTQEMDVEGVFQLPAELDLMLTRDGWAFQENTCGKTIRHPGTFHEERYRRLLKAAGEELIRIVNAYLAMPDYHRYIVNLTGGADTRLVLSAVRAAGHSADIRVTTAADLGSGGEDVHCASYLSAVTHYPFDDSPQEVETLSPVEADRWKRSLGMGICYEWNTPPQWSAYADHKTLELTGLSGEVTTRPFRTMHLRQQDGILHSTRRAVDFQLNRVANNMITDYAKAGHFLVEMYQRELERTAGTSAMSQMEFHHFAYSHGYHVETALAHYQGRPFAMALQSKLLFRLNHMTLDRFRSFRLLLDIQREMDPELAAIPYNHTLYREDQPEDGEPMCSRETLLHADKTPWEQAQARRVSLHLTEQTERGSREQAFSEFDSLLYTGLLENLRLLLTAEPELERNLGNALYYAAVKSRTKKSDLDYLYGKVTSLLDQLRIFNNG